MKKASTYSVVFRDVSVQRTHENHGHHECEEKNNQNGVDDGEPVHLQERREAKRSEI